MPVIVDASAIGAIVFDEPEREVLADHLDGETLWAPELIDLELASVALKKTRRAPEDAKAIAACLSLVAAMPIARRPVPLHEVFALAMKTGLSVYDASYLWLSLAHDAELVSLDKTLMRLAPA